FFQAEDGIRDRNVTGVQTLLFRSSPLDQGSAYKIVEKPFITHGDSGLPETNSFPSHLEVAVTLFVSKYAPRRSHLLRSRLRCLEIGRASCRERRWSERSGG